MQLPATLESELGSGGDSTHVIRFERNEHEGAIRDLPGGFVFRRETLTKHDKSHD